MASQKQMLLFCHVRSSAAHTHFLPNICFLSVKFTQNHLCFSLMRSFKRCVFAARTTDEKIICCTDHQVIKSFRFSLSRSWNLILIEFWKNRKRQMLSFIFGHGVNTQQTLCQEVQKSDYRCLKMPTAHTVTDACCLETNLTLLSNIFCQAYSEESKYKYTLKTISLRARDVWDVIRCIFLMLWNQPVKSAGSFDRKKWKMGHPLILCPSHQAVKHTSLQLSCCQFSHLHAQLLHLHGPGGRFSSSCTGSWGVFQTRGGAAVALPPAGRGL